MSKISKFELVHLVPIWSKMKQKEKVVTCSKNKLFVLKQKFTALKTNYLF